MPLQVIAQCKDYCSQIEAELQPGIIAVEDTYYSCQSRAGNSCVNMRPHPVGVPGKPKGEPSWFLLPHVLLP